MCHWCRAIFFRNWFIRELGLIQNQDFVVFSVIVYYAGLVFVTDYIPDKRRYIFLGGKPTLFKTRCKKKEVTEELKIQFCEMAQQYKKVMTPDMRKKISERYNKWCAKGIFSVDTRQEQRTCAADPLLFSLNGQKKIRILKLWSFGRGSTGVRLSSAIPLLHLRRSDKQHCIPRKIYNAVRACLSSPFRPQSK